MDFYARATPPIGFIATISTRDANGDGFTTNWAVYATQSGWSGGFSNLYGDITLGAGNWVTDPPYGSNVYARGYDVYPNIVARWTGFEFK